LAQLATGPALSSLNARMVAVAQGLG
jgi:hypothetical protein